MAFWHKKGYDRKKKSIFEEECNIIQLYDKTCFVRKNNFTIMIIKHYSYNLGYCLREKFPVKIYFFHYQKHKMGKLGKSVHLFIFIIKHHGM